MAASHRQSVQYPPWMLSEHLDFIRKETYLKKNNLDNVLLSSKKNELKIMQKDQRKRTMGVD